MVERSVEANGIRFGLLEAGPPDGPLVLCLHGFPDSAWTWRHLLPALASDGYHVVAPFMRGYAPTEAPAAGAYAVAALGADATALHDLLGGGKPAVVIGHDWGAAAAYAAVSADPSRWRCVVTASVPPTGHLALDLISDEQMRRSWYSYLLQLPVAELVVSADDLAFLDRLWADWSPGYDARQDLAHVKAALGDPASLLAAISYYRDTPTAIRSPAGSRPFPADLPFLYLHGSQDGCIGVDVLDIARPFFPSHAEIDVVEAAGHFLHLERPDQVNRLIRGFLSLQLSSGAGTSSSR